jgi:GH24 family phage-related lysozyme (muramidase)
MSNDVVSGGQASSGVDARNAANFSAGDTIDFANQPNLTTVAVEGAAGAFDVYSGNTLVATITFAPGVSEQTLEPVSDQKGGTEIVADPASVPLLYTTASQPGGTRIDWNLIDANEGGNYLNPYVPVPAGDVTVGIGVDLGTGISRQQFSSLFPTYATDPNLAFLYNAIGGVGDLDYLNAGLAVCGLPVTYEESVSVSITQSQADTLTNFAQQNISQAVIEEYDAASKNQFVNLPAGVQTVLVDIAYNVGPGNSVEPGVTGFNFYKDAVALDLANPASYASQLENLYADMMNVTLSTPNPVLVGRIRNDARHEIAPLLPASFTDMGGQSSAACFVAGTHIATERGAVRVETLRAGERIITVRGERGAREAIWLGHRTVDCHRHPKPHDVWPVRILAHAFGDGRPCRDLLLSPDHSVFVGGALTPIGYLVNGASIIQEPTDAVTYWHVELPQHDILLAEGLPC